MQFTILYCIIHTDIMEELISKEHTSACIDYAFQRVNGVLNIVLPTRDPCRLDCICPVILITNPGCYNFQSCSCIADTRFNGYLYVCVSNGTMFNVCFSNLNSAMNNSLLHLYQTKYSNCQNEMIYLYRNYVKSFKIIVTDNLNYIVPTTSTTSIIIGSKIASRFIGPTLDANSISFTPFVIYDASDSIHNTFIHFLYIILFFCISVIIFVSCTITQVIIARRKRNRSAGATNNQQISQIQDQRICDIVETTSVQMTSNPAYQLVKL